MKTTTMKTEILRACARCKRLVNSLEVFPGGLCLACYEVDFDKLSPAEQVPNFDPYTILKGAGL